MQTRLVKRVCLCGCALSFKVSKTNTTNYFFSLGHAEFASSRQDEIGEKARRHVRRVYSGFGSPSTIAGKRQVRAKRKFYATNFTPETDELDFIEPTED